jgi:hypothetical protein
MPKPYLAPAPPVCCEPPPCPPPQAPLPTPAPPCGCLPFFIDVEYLGWWIKKSPANILLTTGNLAAFIPGVPNTIPGALGVPGTQILFNQFSNGNMNSGGRITAGVWFDSGAVLGLQGSYFILGDANGRAVTFSGDGSTGSTVLTRPFFDVANGVQNADPVNLPGLMSGTITFRNPRTLQGGEANLVYNYFQDDNVEYRLSLIGGGRIVSLNERILINEFNRQLPDAFGNPAIDTFINENFGTRNVFYGGQLGGQYEYQLGPIYLQLVGKVALGVTDQAVEINGATTQISPANAAFGLPTTLTSPTGLLVQPGNSGLFRRSVFSVVPEGQANIALVLNEYITLKLGYTLLFWNNVSRPGTYMDRRVTIQPLNDPVPVQPASPVFSGFQSSSFWAQGFNAGLVFSF